MRWISSAYQTAFYCCILLFAVNLPLLGQNNTSLVCEEYQGLLKEGDDSFKKSKYEEAIQAYTAFMVVCPEQARVANQKILLVFKAIDSLRKQAEENERIANSEKKRAELNEKKAKIEKKRAEIESATSKSLLMTSIAKDWAKEGLYTEATALLQTAYDTAEQNGAQPPIPLQNVLANIYYGKETTWQKAKFNLHTSRVNSVAFSPNGKYILTGSADNTTILWNLQGKPIRTFNLCTSRVNSVAFSPDGKYILTGGGKEYKSKPDIAILWNLKGDTIKTFKGHTGSISSVSFSPNGKYILTGSGDSTAILWNLKGDTIKTFKGHTGSISSVSFSPNGKYILTGSWDGSAIIWNLKGDTIKTFKGHINSVAFSPNGKHIFTGSRDGSAILWNLQGDTIQTFNLHTSSVHSVAFSPDGKSILTGGSAIYNKPGIAILWNLQGKPIQIFKGFTGDASVAFSPDGKSILTGSEDNAILWNLEGKLIPRTLNRYTEDILSISFSPNGKHILTGGGDFDGRSTAILWNLLGDTIQTFNEQHVAYITSVVFSPDGQHILTGGSADYDKSGIAILWNLLGDTIQTFKMHAKRVNSVAFSPDGQNILTGGYEGIDEKSSIKPCIAILWNLQGDTIRTFKGHTNSISSVTFSPDGKHILTGSWDGSVILWDLLGESTPLFEKKPYVSSVAFSPDGEYILTGGKDNAILWDFEGSLIHTFKEPYINSVAFSPDGKYILTGGEDNAILWDFEGRLIHTFKEHAERVSSVAFSPDGKYILTGSEDNTAKLFYSPKGIKSGMDILFGYLMPERQEASGLTVKSIPTKQDKTPWALWEHGLYWENKEQYKNALSFYQKYAQLFDAPQAYIAIHHIHQKLEKNYAFNFLRTEDINSLWLYADYFSGYISTTYGGQKEYKLRAKTDLRLALQLYEKAYRLEPREGLVELITETKERIVESE